MEELELTRRATEALERMAAASEKLNALATEERDAHDLAAIFEAPTCPHCGAANPVVRNEGGEGAMSDFVLVGRCSNCTKTMYAIPQGFVIFTVALEAREALERRNTA